MPKPAKPTTIPEDQPLAVQLPPVSTPNDIALAEHAEVIRALGKRVVGDIIEIGRRLTDAKKIAGHGGWLPWLEREFGWDDRTAQRFMQVHTKSDKLSDLNLPVSGLYLLAAPSTPEEAQQEIIDRAKNGEALSVKEVQRIIDEAREKDAAASEQVVADLRAEIERREEAVRAEYAGKLVVEPEKLQQQIAEAVAKELEPLQRKLTATEKKLETAKKRLAQKVADEEPQPDQSKVDNRTSLASTNILMAVEPLSATKAGVTRNTRGTGEEEWHTPQDYVDAARAVLGAIDVDPASSEQAQQTVRAARYFTKESDGLAQDWTGRVWLNPPHAPPLIADFSDKLVAQVVCGNVIAAITLTHNDTDAAWFQKLALYAKAICFTRGRVCFVSPDGTLAEPKQGQAFFYFGDEIATFVDVFKDIGCVVIGFRDSGEEPILPALACQRTYAKAK
jgi:hypothetical protein